MPLERWSGNLETAWVRAEAERAADTWVCPGTMYVFTYGLHVTSALNTSL